MADSTLAVIDANGATKTLKVDDTAGIITPKHLIDGTATVSVSNTPNVAVTSLVSLPAGSNAIGSISAIGEGAVPGEGVYVSTSKLPVKRAFANINQSTTDGSVVAAVTSKKIRVVALVLHAGGSATTITLNSKPAGAGAAISAAHALAAYGSLVLPFAAAGWLETAQGEGLSATTGAGASVGVEVLYVEA